MVESTPPVPQFSVTASSDRTDPSQFILDATSSFDYDILNSNDKLNFVRGFSDPENTKVIDQSDDKKQLSI